MSGEQRGGVLALDYGDRKCGFASTDALGIAREPLAPLRHEGREDVLLAHLERLLGQRDISTLLVGLPLNADGSSGPRAKALIAFVTRLRARFPALAILTWDEHLTTKEAESRLSALGRKGREVRAERDSWSALVLLDDWLQSRTRSP